MNGKAIRYNLIEEELDYLHQKDIGSGSKFFNRVFRRMQNKEMIPYRFCVPSSFFLRGELLCEDVSYDSDFIFTHTDLLGTLIDDFVKQIRIQTDLHFIFRGLMARDKRPAILRTYTGDQSQIKLHHRKDMSIIRCCIRRREALRIEVLLSEIGELYEDSNYAVEDILQILYCDFILSIKNGNAKQAMNQIIKTLNQEI